MNYKALYFFQYSLDLHQDTFLLLHLIANSLNYIKNHLRIIMKNKPINLSNFTFV